MEKLNLLYSRSQIAHRVRQLAEAINRDYQGRELVLLGVMKGSFVFVADLIRLLDLPLALDFMGLSSYGAGQQSSGRIVLTREPTIALQDRDVLLVEDIADTGLTAAFALDYLRRTKPHSLKFCVLMDRTERRQIEIPIDYWGFRFKKGFVVGYGLDHAERFRNLPDIHCLENRD